MTTHFSKISKWILSPFTEDWPFFSLMFVLIGLPNLYFHFNLNVYVYTIYLGMMYYILAFLLSHITSIVKPISKWIKPTFIIFASIYCSLSFFCLRTYGCLLSPDFVEIMAGTNIDEVNEFFRTFVTWSDTLVFVFIIAILPLLYIWLAKVRYILSINLAILPTTLLILSIAGLFHNLGMLAHEIKGENNWNFKFDEIVDLREHPTFPSLIESDSIHPQNIVVILGESFSKNHSTLYGYQKKTNPLLEKKMNDGNLIIFDKVTAPAPSTTKAFKYLLTTYTLEDEKKEKKWYEYTNVIEAFRTIGFHTTWVSTQNEKGMFDNLPSGYSKLCDKVIFDNRNTKPKYDDYLISVFNPDSISLPSLVFYHMMGQHEGFADRYPDQFCQFGPKNKKGLGSDKEDVLADYDNATLFNDYVVSSIMDLYKNENAIILYFPDHGLDVCDTDPTYFGHARATQESQNHCKQIPFMIYFTNVFLGSYPSIVNYLKNKKTEEFCTDKFIYLLLEITGYKLQAHTRPQGVSELS